MMPQLNKLTLSIAARLGSGYPKLNLLAMSLIGQRIICNLDFDRYRPFFMS
jgi:hypothetical protein